MDASVLLQNPLAARAGVPQPPALRRWEPGQELLTGPALLLGTGAAPLLPAVRGWLRAAGAAALEELPEEEERLGAVVVDASAARTVDDLAALRAPLAPAFRRLARGGRVLLLGTPPAQAPGVEAAAVQQGLEGFSRSLGKETRGGATVNLLRVAEGAGDALRAPLLFLASARAAYVSGQVLDVAPAPGPVPDRAVRTAVVTGAAQGIGAATAEVLARGGAHVVCADLAASGEALAAVANRVGGSTLHLDVTADDAPRVLAEHLARRFGGADVVVHNAGVTRDRSFVNLDDRAWRQVLDVNLRAPLRLTDGLLAADGALAPGARFVCLSSVNGLAGARGQTNYAASKAGLVGFVRAQAGPLAARGFAVNAVAPGFVETAMTAAMPFVAREVARRASSLQQGGLPVDVAEAVAFLAQPDAGGVNGQVLRVCGQNLVGA
ncbi:3-oxoacyl-ACP reductase [Kineococcus sp. SYSU DK004]|uniref:3-oxoacyl-ACP reductase n=1 Tax=Kineococcus sp. SYSU DK004 TaxID=3383125 RepID=UPI003D7EA35F